MPTLLQLVHGYPPREVAGTELYAARLTAALARRGWRVHVLAATRAPGRRQGELLREELPGGGELVRRVDNLPHRPLGRGEGDADVERCFDTLVARTSPDLVHIQHLLALSARLESPVPTVATLHDAWSFCPRGGTLLRQGTTPCGGPAGAGGLPAASEDDCARCYDDWAAGSRGEHALAGLAGQVGRVVRPERLHHAWKRLPGSVRGVLRHTGTARTTADAVRRWRRAVAGAFRRAQLRLAPSVFLARAAEASGIGAVSHLPQGVDGTARWVGGAELVFVGSLVPHKGAHLVSMAADRAGRALAIHGPATDPAYVAGLPSERLCGLLEPDQVQATLARSAALVVGSTWPENAPLIVCEARAVGCPVVAPDIGGLPELVEDGVHGFLYAPGDVDSLADALARLDGFRPSHDPPPSFEDHVDRLVAFFDALV